MKRLIIVAMIVLANLYVIGTKGQGVPQAIECLNCCAVTGGGTPQGPCTVVCTEKKYNIHVSSGTVPGGCTFPAQAGYTATLIDSTGGGCLYEVVFSAPGTYNIQGSCFIVLAHPQAIISNSNPITVCKGSPVNFINGSLNATHYSWDFGDPASGALNTSNAAGSPVTHIYNAPGTYTVTLVATTSIATNNGTIPCCADTVQTTVIVDSSEGPTVECLSPVCDNTSATYCITNNPSGCTYTWSSNAGNIVSPSGNCATYNWTTEPLGSIILTPSGANCCPYPTTFYVPIMPSGSFAINGNTTVCGGSFVLYNAPAIWGATYNWSITPSVSFSTPNPANPSQISVQWPGAGTYTITCNMGNDVLDCDATGTITVTVQPKFQISGPAETCVNQPVTFTSTAAGTTWSVSPAASCSPSGTNFNCSFSTPGTYTISASATGFCNNPSTTIVVHPQPAAPVLAGPLQVLPGCTYTYTATGSGTMNWNVTPGTATVVNAGNSIQVTWPASFTTGSVSTTVTQNNCPSAATTINISTVPPPTISGGGNVCSNGQTNFSVSTLPPNCTIQWTVSPASAGSVTAGQGTANATVDWYTVAAATNATVTATITNQCTNTTFATLNASATIQPLPNVSISGNLLFCTGSSTTITATAGFPSYSWDGVSGPSNTHVFTTAGQHYVEATDNNGCKKKIYFTLAEIPAPTVTLSTTAVPTCVGSVLQPFTLATTIAPGYTVTNITFTNPASTVLCSGTSPSCFVSSPIAGTYTVTVSFNFIYNGNPVSCTKTATINIGCGTGGGSGSGCTKNPQNCQYNITYTYLSCNTVQLTINPNPPCGTFNNPDSITLNWGDGNTTNIFSSFNSGSQTYILTHTYNQPAYYHLFLECNLGSVDIPVGGAVNFSLVRNGCAVDLLDFSSAISGSSFVFTSVDWGDGNINTSTSHTYANSGTYAVILNYTLNGGPCADTQTITYIKPDFTINAPAALCANQPVTFSATLTSPFTAANVASYEWDFGDGSALSNDTTPAHSYTTPGNYVISLTIEDIYGCAVTKTLNITVNAPTPYTLTSNSPQCDSVILTINTPSGFGNPTAVSWTPSTVNISGFQYAAFMSGLYTATVTDANGCNTILSQNVTVYPPPVINLFAEDSLCTGVGDTITTDASVSQFSLSWQITGISTAYSQSGTGAGIIFSPATPGTYEVSLVATLLNAPNCSVTLKDTIEVFSSPSVFLTSSATGIVCAGNPVTLTANPSGGTSPYIFNWNTGQTINPITVYANAIYTVQVTDANGCKATSSINSNISPLPDFTVFARGCDTLCFDKTDTIHGPAGYANYQFLIDNTTVQNGPVSYLQKPCGQSIMSDGLPHVVQLIVTTAAGC